MDIQILLFGQLAEITGKTQLIVDDVADIAALNFWLQQQFPRFKELNYLVAINHHIVHGNQTLTGDMVVALMPPFSGG